MPGEAAGTSNTSATLRRPLPDVTSKPSCVGRGCWQSDKAGRRPLPGKKLESQKRSTARISKAKHCLANHRRACIQRGEACHDLAMLLTAAGH